MKHANSDGCRETSIHFLSTLAQHTHIHIYWQFSIHIILSLDQGGKQQHTDVTHTEKGQHETNTQTLKIQDLISVS